MTVAHHAVAQLLHTTYAVAHMLHTTYAAAHMLYICCAQTTGVNCIIKLLHTLLHTWYIQHMLQHTLLHTTHAAHLEWIIGKVGTWVAQLHWYGKATLQMKQLLALCILHHPTHMPQKTKRKDYAFRRQFNENPSIILGSPGAHMPDTSTNRMIMRFTKSRTCMYLVRGEIRSATCFDIQVV